MLPEAGWQGGRGGVDKVPEETLPWGDTGKEGPGEEEQKLRRRREGDTQGKVRVGPEAQSQNRESGFYLLSR